MAGNLHPEGDEDFRDIDDLAGGALVNLVGKLGRLSRALYLWVVAVLFGAEVLGLYTLAWSIIFTLGRVGRFGLQRGVPHFVAAARIQRNPYSSEAVLAGAVQISLVTSLPLALFAAVLGPQLARFFEDPHLVSAIRVMAPCIPLLALAALFVESTRALRIMRFGVYVYSVAGPLILLVTGLIAAGLDAGLLGLAWAQLVMSLGMFVLAAAYCSRYYSMAAVALGLFRPTPWLQMVRFCFPVMLTDVFYALLLRVDIFILGMYLEAEAIGVYSAARRVSSILLKVPQSFDPIFSPMVSDLAARGHSQRLGTQFVALARWILTIDLVFVGAILLAGESVLQLFGAEFTAGLEALIILGLGAVLQGVFTPAELILIMGGRPGLNLITNVIWLAATFLLNLLLIPRLGVAGAATAATLAIAGVTALRLGAIYRIHRIHPFRWSQLKPLAAATLACGGSLIFRQALPAAGWADFAVLGLFVPLYGGALYALGVDPEDRALVRRSIQKRRAGNLTGKSGRRESTR